MVCYILVLFVCIPTINNLFSVRTDRRNAKSRTTFRVSFRKQMPIPELPAQVFKTKKKLESYYEPYWSNGDWVYYRGESTQRPHAFILNDGNATQHDECSQICPQFVQDYGLVCGQRYNEINKQYEHRAFEDYCHLELQNCISASKRWYPIKKGNCTETMTTQRNAHVYIVTGAATFEDMLFNNSR